MAVATAQISPDLEHLDAQGVLEYAVDRFHLQRLDIQRGVRTALVWPLAAARGQRNQLDIVIRRRRLRAVRRFGNRLRRIDRRLWAFYCFVTNQP